jgi:hypothetical protein
MKMGNPKLLCDSVKKEAGKHQVKSFTLKGQCQVTLNGFVIWRKKKG